MAEAWRVCFRDLIAPHLPLRGLRQLADELRRGGRELCRGSTYVLSGMTDPPVVRRCCPALYCFWDGGGYRVGKKTLDDAWERLVEQTAMVAGTYSAANDFVSVWDAEGITCEELLAVVVGVIEGETTGV